MKQIEWLDAFILIVLLIDIDFMEEVECSQVLLACSIG